MGASFRNVGEITELAGCDLLTISPKLLGELNRLTGELPRKLDPTKAQNLPIQKITMNEKVFEEMHAADCMSHDKLTEGIDGFTKALGDLESLLKKRLSELKSSA